MRLLRKAFRYGIVSLISILVLAISINYWVIANSNSKCYDSVSGVPYSDVGLVLGTSKYTANGNVNFYFRTRLDAALKLYKTGRIKHLLLSGDNSINGYNEPQDMKDYLVERGVSENAITLDYAGLRTLDSIYRAKEIFGLSSFVIVSQKFHNQRAIYLASAINIEAHGYNAIDVGKVRLRRQSREFCAKVKAWLDVNVLWTQPKYLGEKISINV